VLPHLFFRVGPELYACQPDKDFHHDFPGGTTSGSDAFLDSNGLIELIFRQKRISSQSQCISSCDIPARKSRPSKKMRVK
jgi:hypothetical protein